MNDACNTEPASNPLAAYRYDEILPAASLMLEELLKASEIHELFESYYKLITIPVAIIDLHANVLLSSRWQRICTQFHRVNPTACANCIECDTKMALQLKEGQTYTIYSCLNGLTDCASPIIIEGKHIANLFIGQFLTKKPDETRFLRQAKEFGFEATEYIAALKEVPVVDEKNIPNILDLLVRMTRVITKLSVERKRAIESQTRQSIILDTIPQSVFWKDIEGKYLGCNAPFAKAAGLSTPNDIVGKSDFDLPWPRQEAEAYRADDLTVISTNRPRLHVTEPLQQSDGSRIVIDTSKYPLVDVSNSIYGVVGVYEDITERKRAEEELTNSLQLEALLTELFARFVDVPIQELDFEITNSQRRICELLDLDLSSIYQQSSAGASELKLSHLYRRQTGVSVPEVLIGPDYFPWCSQQLVSGKMVAVNSMQELPAEAARDQESWRHYGIKSSLMFPLLGRGPAILGTISFDRTRDERHWTSALIRRLQLVAQIFANSISRKNAEVALRASEAYRRTIFESARDAILIMRNERFIDCNSSALSLYGTDRKFFIGNALDDFSPACQPDGHLSKDSALERIGAVLNGIPQFFDWKHQRLDGTLFDVEVSLNRVDFGDEVLIQAIVRDVTDRKRADTINSSRLRIIQYAASHSLDDLLEYTLNEAEKLADSLISFFHFVESDQQTLVFQNWSTRTKSVFCQAKGKGEHYTIGQAGVWVECVHQGKPVIHNDYASLPNRKGLPEGHAQIIRELVVPVIRNGAVKAVLGVGNKPTDYTDKDVQALSLLADLAWEIADRKRAEDELRASEERYRGLVNTMEDIIYSVTPDGKILFIGPQVQRYGFTSEDLISRPFRDFIVPEDQAASLSRFQNSLATGEDDLATFRIRARDGRIVWIEEIGRPVRDGDGNIISISGMLRDITERKQAEAVLMERESRLRALFDNAGNSICLAKMGVQILGNRAFVDLFGYKDADALVGRPVIETIAPEEKERISKYVDDRGKGIDAPIHYETKGLRRDGTIFDMEVTVSTYESDNEIYTVGFHTDISERKRAEDALRMSEERFRAIYERAPIGVALMDSISGRFLQVNPMYCEIVGYSQREMLALDYMNLTHTEDLQQDLDEMDRLRRGESNYYKIEKRYIRKDGTTAWVQLHVVSLTWKQGILTEHLAIVSDVNDRKRAEQEKTQLEVQIQQAQKMESVGRLAGGVAHDFNNMLGIIIGNAELALSQADPAQPLYDDLTEIRKAAERSANLTRQLLAFARKQTVAPRLLNLNQTVGEMLKMLQRLIGENIDLKWHPSESLWQVRIDPSQIDQILANLCVNARDAIKDGGTITIETRNSILDENYCAAHIGSVPGEYVTLTVSDDGCGMDQETLSKIYEPFFTTKGVGKGTGLGLSTVYGIVKQNNGFINTYSDTGHGTTFTIYLPRHEGRDGQAAGTVGSAESLMRGHETVLLVEDNASIMKLTARMLEKQGYTVLTASTPGEALRFANEHSDEIHLLLTDVVMPEMNGRDLAKNLMDLYPNLRLLFMSGYTADVIAHNGVLDEGVHFIQKPFSTRSLAIKLREVLDSV